MNSPGAPARLFVAVPVPEPVKSRIETVQAELRHKLPGMRARWTPREQLHLTLKFLGGVEAGRIDSLTDSLRRACAEFAPLRLSAEGIGCFPNLRRARVVWVGVKETAGRLAGLQKAVEAACREFTGEPPEKDFAGHITLARLKELSHTHADGLGQAVTGAAGQRFGEWQADSVELFRSELTSAGALHHPVAVIPLSEAATQ